MRAPPARRSVASGSCADNAAATKKKVPPGCGPVGTKVGVWECCSVAQNSQAVGSRSDSWPKFFRSKFFGEITNLVFPEPDDWELERQDIINTDRVEPGTEIAAWLEAFRRLGYCVLEPSGPGLAKSEGDADPRPPQKRR